MWNERLIELISGSLDDALSAEEIAELEQALAADPSARDLQAKMASDRGALQALPSLTAPPQLKRQALQNAQQRRPVASRLWLRRGLMAASVLIAAGLFWQARPESPGARLNLRPGQLTELAAAEASELMSLTGGDKGAHLMLSEALTGRYQRGTARLQLRCDAGNAAQAHLVVRLAFDFDGDGNFDLRSEPQVLPLDSTEGYQTVACEVPLAAMTDLEGGRVQVELATVDENAPPVKVRLEPGQATIDLPYQGLVSLPEA